MNISFDIHDTILATKIGSKINKIQFFRTILYSLNNFKPFVFTYTLFCKRNEKIINEMIRLKNEGNKIIILTSTNIKCKKIILHFLDKNKIVGLHDEIIFKTDFWQSESDFKIQQMQKNNISIHYDDGIEVCKNINKINNLTCILVKK